MSKESPNSRPYYKVDPNLDRYIPNHVPASELLWNTVLSLLVLAWGAYGLWADDLIVPTKRGRAMHLHGTAAWVMFAAMISAALNLLSLVADHYDIRNNELSYRRFAFGTQVAGWAFAGLAVLLHFSQ